MYDYDRRHVLAAFVRRAVDLPAAFGEVAYAVFLRLGISGLNTPEKLHGVDPIKLSVGQIVGALPSGYGAKFGRKAWALALKAVKDRSKAEDLLAAVAENILDGRHRLSPGSPLRAAEGYVLRAITNAAIDLARAESRRKEQPMSRSGPAEEGPNIDLADPRSLAVLESVPTELLRRVFREIARVHPRAPEYLDATLRGLTKTEIARQGGVTPAAVSKWVAVHSPAMERAVEHHLRSAAAAGMSMAERVAVRFVAVAVSL